MIRPAVFSSISIEPVLAPATPHMVASMQPATVQPAMPHPMPAYETFLSSLSFLLAAIVATAELIRMSGDRARRRAEAVISYRTPSKPGLL